MTSRADRAAAKAKAKARSQAAFFAALTRKHSRPDAPFGKREYLALYRAQGGKCYVCRIADGSDRRLGVDHDHLTGEVRGLVCTGSLDAKTCNRLIAIRKRAELIRAAEMLSDPPPARAVLQAIRAGTTIPSMVGGESFELWEVDTEHMEES